MVNTLSHLGVGLLLSYALGLKGKKRLGLVLLSLFPDLDYFTYSIFTLISGSVSHEVRNHLFYLLGHREFTHSIFFSFLIALFIWIKTKDRVFAFGGFQAVFLHALLDYTTSSKMRPFYPFSTNESALRAIYPFDPVINILPLLPVVIVTTEFLKNRHFWNAISKKISRAKNANIRSRDIWNIKNVSLLSIQNRDISKIENMEIWIKKLNGLNNLQSFVSINEKKLYASVILILLIWITVLPITKMFLLNRVSDAEEAKIVYKNTYPVSPGKFLAAYSYNNTHYKLLEVNYWSGVEKSFYVEKISVIGDVPDVSTYTERAGKLYSTSVPQAIDYPVYLVSEKNGNVTVVLSDARRPYVDKWPYFDTVYRFVFDRESGEYRAYESHYGRAEKKLDKNYFE
jgi:inner membrane protein